MSTEVIKNEYGYHELAEKPSPEQLREYYEQKYYQQHKGAYQKSYSEEERTFIANRVNRKYAIVQEELGTTNRGRLLDVGCGEGWTLAFFRDKGWEVMGLEYSDYGLLQFNEHVRDALKTGDTWDNLHLLVNDGQQFDVIILDNVLEHVLDAAAMMGQLRDLLSQDGLLIIEVPNDFSILQEHLLSEGQIDRPFWVVVPDHISYFNKEGLINLAQATGWQPVRLSTDFPIDISLLNPDSNYVMDRSKGKPVHHARVSFENLLDTRPTEHVNQFYEALAQLGLGRNLIGFFKKNAR